MAIFSTEKFLRKLKVGGRFWHIECTFGVPSRIIGPCKILKIYEAKVGTKVSYSDINEKTYESYVDDLTNSFHGVFMTKKTALKHYLKKKKAYRTDSILIKEVEDAKKAYFDDHEEIYRGEGRYSYASNY